MDMDNYDFNRLEAKLDRLIALKEWEMQMTISGRQALLQLNKKGKLEIKKPTSKLSTADKIVLTAVALFFVGCYFAIA